MSKLKNLERKNKKSRKQSLFGSIREKLMHNKDGSGTTRGNRERMLILAGKQLHQLHFKLKHVDGLKQKHIRALNNHWLETGINPATIKNRNAALHWLCEKIGKADMMPSNDELGVPKRQYYTNKDKSVDITEFDLTKVHEQLEIQLNLERYFGLRRKEAIMIQPHVADKGDTLALEGKWCKGGRPRKLPIDSEEKRYWLERAKAYVPTKRASLGGRNSYEKAVNIYDKRVQRAGISNPHRLRHKFAQEGYKLITGLEAPVKGNGSPKAQLTKAQIDAIKQARLTVSEHLGHSRENISSIYIGKK